VDSQLISEAFIELQKVLQESIKNNILDLIERRPKKIVLLRLFI